MSCITKDKIASEVLDLVTEFEQGGTFSWLTRESGVWIVFATRATYEIGLIALISCWSEGQKRADAPHPTLQANDPKSKRSDQ